MNLPAQGGVVVIVGVRRVYGTAERRVGRRVKAGQRRGLLALGMCAGVLAAVAAVESARGNVGPVVTYAVTY